MSLCTRYLTCVDLHTPLLLLGVFKTFLAIRAPWIVTEGIIDSSPTLFSESLDSSSTWGFLDDVWELPCIMFQNLNLPFHGVLLDPLIEDSCGPLINCDFYSTFDETSPFLAFPSSATFNGEYQFIISSSITSLFTCNFWVEGSNHLYFFCFEEYPMKIHLSTFRYSYDFFSSRTCIYAMQSNTLRCETSGLLPMNFSSSVMPWTIAMGVRFMI